MSEGKPRLGVSAALPVVPVVAAAAVLVKALLLEQPLGMRTMSLAAVAGVGTLLALLPITALFSLMGGNWRPWLRGGLAAAWMAGAFAPATMLAFAIENRLIEGHVEADSVTDLTASDLFWTLFGGMGLFTPTGLHFLLPWPLLAVALTTYFCFHRWPNQNRPEQPARSTP